MVFVDMPGLPKDLNVTYRPPRVSLFPPSYQDRAFLRSIHREVIRQVARRKGSQKKYSCVESEDNTEVERLNTATQTMESHCYHSCSTHPIEEKSIKETKKHRKSKSRRRAKKCKECDSESDSDETDSDGLSSESSDSENDNCKHHKNKKRRPKFRHRKSRSCRDNKKMETNLKIPDAVRPFLPYPLSSPNVNLIWSKDNYEKLSLDVPPTCDETPPGWNLDLRIEAARRADERYVSNWLAQHDGNQQQTAFHWLADRDRQRQAKVAQVAHDLAALSLDPSADRVPWAFPSGPIYPNPQLPGANHGTCSCMKDNEHNHPMNNWIKPVNNANNTAHTNQYPHGQHKQRNQGTQQVQQSEQSQQPQQPHSAQPRKQKGSKTPVPRKAGGHDQLTESGGAGLGGDGKKKSIWAVDGQNTGGSRGHDPGKDSLPNSKKHPFFVDDPPSEDTDEADHQMSGAISPVVDRYPPVIW